MVTYQFEIDDDEWHAWKGNVPRSKSLDTRIRELLRADREGRIQPREPTTSEPSTPAPEPEPPTAKQESTKGSLESLEDFPAGCDPDECWAAVQAAEQYIRSEGSATMSEIVAAVMPEHPVGYDVDDALERIDSEKRYRGAWWRRVVRPSLETHRNVEKPPRGRSEWKWIGESS